MKCIEVVELMTDYLEGALNDRDRERFEDHISGCDGCRAYLEQLRVTRRAVRQLAQVDMPTELQRELVTAFRTWRSG